VGVEEGRRGLEQLLSLVGQAAAIVPKRSPALLRSRRRRRREGRSVDSLLFFFSLRVDSGFLSTRATKIF
jgi:hypothetical protein